MKTRILFASVSLSLLALLAGCADANGPKSAGSSDAALIPPTAQTAPLAPLQVPVYPPLGYNANPSLAPTTPIGPQNGRVVNMPNQPNAQRVVSRDYSPSPVVPPSRYDDRYTPNPKFDRGYYDYDRGYDRGYARGVESSKDRFVDARRDVDSNPNIIPNSPILTPNNILELNAVGMGVAPESTISPAQALALAKRAAIIDGYRQLGEKMYGIRLSGQDTVREYVLQSSTTKARVESLIRNAEITETVYKDGLCQVSMEVKLDGRIWYRLLSAR